MRFRLELECKLHFLAYFPYAFGFLYFVLVIIIDVTVQFTYTALVSCWGCVVFDPAHMRVGLYPVFTVHCTVYSKVRSSVCM